MLRGGAVAANSTAVAENAAADKGRLARTSTKPLQADKKEWTGRTVGRNDADPDRSRVLAAMAVQSWYRAARERAEIVTSRLPATLKASSAVVSLENPSALLVGTAYRAAR